jgi:tetratricopeptide (TPR) repeat protein
VTGIVAVALGLVLAVAGSGFASGREEALTKLGDRADAVGRRDAVRTLAATGTMDDVPRLAEALRDPDRGVRIGAEAAMWEIWSRSGDPNIDQRLAVGVQQMNEGRWHEAEATFTAIIGRRPDFAEAWNKRATVYYLMGQYQKSLADCDEVIKRNPLHYGALSGYGMIYTQLDRPASALEYYERALAVNPNLDGVRNAAEILREQLIRQRRDSI